MKDETWINPDFKHGYWVCKEASFFTLIQVSGSLSSAKVYNSREDAIKDGWKIKSKTGSTCAPCSKCGWMNNTDKYRCEGCGMVLK